MRWLTSVRTFLLLLIIEVTWALLAPGHHQEPYGNLNLSAEQQMGTVAGNSPALPALESKIRKHDPIFNEAVQILDSMKTSPSCHRIAATRLVTSCQTTGKKDTLENPQAHEYVALDRIRSIYAARLAICELDGAGASIPAPCLPVTVSPLPVSKSRFSFLSKTQPPDPGVDLLPDGVLGDCLKALESRPQWWTSYSNNRQNAMVICQAARIEVEREQLLDLHRGIVKTSSKLGEGLQEALHNAAMEASQHNAFLEIVRDMQERVIKDLEESTSITRSALGRILEEIQSGLEKIANSASSVMDRVLGEAGILEKEIQNSSESLISLQKSLQELQADTVTRSQELARIHEEDVLTYHDVVSGLQNSLDSLIEKDMDRLFQRIMTFDASLEWVNSRLVLVLEQENIMSQRLQLMEIYMEQSYNRANDLQKAQQLQAEVLANQLKVQEEMEFKAQVSQALLDKATATTANLHTMIEEATVKFKRTPGLHAGGISTWTSCGLLLVLIGAQNPRMAVGLFFLIFGHIIATFCFHFF